MAERFECEGCGSTKVKIVDVSNTLRVWTLECQYCGRTWSMQRQYGPTSNHTVHISNSQGIVIGTGNITIRKE